MISCVAPQKLRALLKPSSAAAQKMPGAMQPSSNGNAAKEQTVSQAFAVRACGASGYLSELKSIHSFKGGPCGMRTQHCRGQNQQSRIAAWRFNLWFQLDTHSSQRSK